MRELLLIVIRHYSLTHEGKLMKDRKFCCQHCDYEAKESRSLEHHARAKHEEITFDCHICDYKADYALQVGAHVLDKHEALEYKCGMCEWKAIEQQKVSVQYYLEAFKETVEIEHEATEKDDQIALGSKVKLFVPSGHEALEELVGIKP